MNNWYLLAAIPVFGLLVLVHEFGHFITAKWAGIRVEEFGLGFPPRLVGIRKRDSGGWEVIWLGGSRNAEDAYSDGKQTPFSGTSGGISTSGVSEHTIYSLNFLPIGGFVRMPGESGDVTDANGKYDEGSFAAKSAGKRIIVLVAGVTMNVILAMVLFTIAYGFIGEPTLRPTVGTVVPNSPAAVAGLRSGDTIVAVKGQPIQSFDQLVTTVNQDIANAGGSSTVPVAMSVRHGNSAAPVDIQVNVRVHPPAGQGPMGIVASESNADVIYTSVPLWQAPLKGIQHTVLVTGAFLQAIGQMITGAIKPQLSGPVGIVRITGQTAQSVTSQGWWPLLNLTAVLSLNLAIINILPFPALDGGRILLILIELLRGGKRLKPEREGIINLIGMAVLLTLMIVITISDVTHWGG